LGHQWQVMACGRLGWFTGWVSELRPVPTDPAALKDWVASLNKDELLALTQQVASGALTGHLGRLGDPWPAQPRDRPRATPG